MPKIYIARHGETDFNEQGRYAGRADISLNTNGRQQAEELKQKIKNLNINQIKLRRSPPRETAAERNLNKNILIVTHAFVAKVINKYFNQQISEQDLFDFVLQNAEIKEYRLR